MTCASRKIIYSGFLLLVLLTVIVGQKVHIYTESPLHFAAFSGDLVPDNGARSRVIERCMVDDFCFFPCICAEVSVFEAHFELLGRRTDVPTCSKLQGDMRLAALRAPPAAT